MISLYAIGSNRHRVVTFGTKCPFIVELHTQPVNFGTHIVPPIEPFRTFVTVPVGVVLTSRIQSQRRVNTLSPLKKMPRQTPRTLPSKLIVRPSAKN